MSVLNSMFPGDIARKIADYYYPKSQMTAGDVCKVFINLDRINSIFADVRTICARYNMPQTVGFFNEVENTGYMFNYGDEYESTNCAYTELQKKLHKSNTEYHCDFNYVDYTGLYHIESTIILNSHILFNARATRARTVGSIYDSPIKYIVPSICDKCRSSILTFEDMFDGEKILDICTACHEKLPKKK